jgi:hypothetical protein
VDRELRAALAAGAVAGLAGALTFGTLHWLVIFPTWEPLLIGLLFGPLAGLPAGWAFHELRRARALPRGRAEGPAFGLLLYAALAPVGMVSVARGAGPLSASIDGARVLTDLLAAVPVGLAAGWLLTRRARPALAMGLAGLAFALSLGHNIPFFTAGVRLAKVWGVMLAVALVAGVVLAETVSRRGAARGS